MIPAGASVQKYGGLGYVGFAEEVRAQEKQLGFAFDYIVVCTVTGSTHAGMLVDLPRKVDSAIFSVSSFCHHRPNQGAGANHFPVYCEARRKSSRMTRCCSRGTRLPVRPSVRGNQEAIRLCARLEGIITDPVYEGKSMQGMIDLVQKGFFQEGSRVLYAHLGGGPAINGFSYTFLPQRLTLDRLRFRRPACRRCAQSWFEGRPENRGRRRLISR